MPSVFSMVITLTGCVLFSIEWEAILEPNNGKCTKQHLTLQRQLKTQSSTHQVKNKEYNSLVDHHYHHHHGHHDNHRHHRDHHYYIHYDCTSSGTMSLDNFHHVLLLPQKPQVSFNLDSMLFFLIFIRLPDIFIFNEDTKLGSRKARKRPNWLSPTPPSRLPQV